MEPRTQGKGRPSTGAARIRWITLLAVGAVVLVLAARMSLRGTPPRPQASAAPPPPAVVVTPAIEGTVPVYDESVAQTIAVQTVQLRAQIGGTLEQVLFKEGTEVRQGQLLFVIDQRPYLAALQSAQAQMANAQATLQQALEQVQLGQAEAQLAALKATLLNAHQQVARDRYLVAQQAIGQQQLDNDTAAEQAAAANVVAQAAVVRNAALSTRIGIDQARAGVQQAEAAVMQAQLNLAYTTVRAPIDGAIGLLSVDQGNLVAANQALATMSSVDPMIAQFNVSELHLNQLASLGLVDRADVEAAKAGRPPQKTSAFQLILADGTAYSHPGTFRTLNRAVDPSSGTIVVQALFPNPERFLRPGMYARVRAKLQDRPNTVLIPQAAVLEIQSARTVFVVGPDNTVTLRTITAGEPYGAFFPVYSGVRAGERVIVEGLQKVRPGMPVTPAVQPAPPLPAMSGATK
ncbi:MAG TPA: efflux RND transporter periplasmic adaptor subunit [bacterium]